MNDRRALTKNSTSTGFGLMISVPAAKTVEPLPLPHPQKKHPAGDTSIADTKFQSPLLRAPSATSLITERKSQMHVYCMLPDRLLPKGGGNVKGTVLRSKGSSKIRKAGIAQAWVTHPVGRKQPQFIGV